MPPPSLLCESEPLETVSTKLRETVREASNPEHAIQGLLELGEEMLSVENAHLTWIEPAADYWEAIESTDHHHGLIVPGETYDLGATYCRRVVENQDTIVLSHAAEQGWADDPAYETHGLDCYLGIPVHAGDDTFGTVCFVKQEPRSEPFTSAEQTFAEHLGFECGRLVERRRLETRIRRQDELNAVLGRILRHNLRNALTVIRGRVELLAADVGDALADEVGSLLEQVDTLEALADKSRHINATMSPSLEREQIQLGDLISKIVTRIEDDYPECRIETNLADATVPLAPSMERALLELIENAVKHGGDLPEVTVATRTEEAVILIEIADNGPGLPDHEGRIFGSAVETPLQHGSGLGLWLASWIVDNHEGEIEVLDAVDGTRLQVCLPYTGWSNAEPR